MSGLQDHQREQARVRQSRKRGRDRADRIEQHAEDEAAKLPRAWQPEFLHFVSSARARAEKALIQVEKSALLLPEGVARDAYLKRNNKTTKVSIPRLYKEFVRRKENLALVELYRDAEYEWGNDDDDRPTIEFFDLGDFQALAWLLGDPEDAKLAAVQPIARFIASVLLASIGMGNTLVGFSQAIEMFQFLDEFRMRQLDAYGA